MPDQLFSGIPAFIYYFPTLHCGHAGCTYVALFTLEKVVINAGMPDSPASGQSVTGMNQNADAESSPVAG